MLAANRIKQFFLSTVFTVAKWLFYVEYYWVVAVMYKCFGGQLGFAEAL